MPLNIWKRMEIQMKILVIGAGGREHALVCALNKSDTVEQIFSLPGNGGINKIATFVDISVKDFQEISNFCKENLIDLVVVGPEEPLVDGIVDFLEDEGIKCFGPSAAAARIEGSKEYMKQLAKKYNIPSAEFESFTDANLAKEYVKSKQTPIVIKTDGLAAGKGVIIAESISEANKAIDEMFAGRFGEAGQKVVIEEFMTGEEVSFFALSDGENAIAFGSVQDHKAVGEGDTGPNTGGMGTYSPAPVVTDEIHEQIMDTLINPLIYGMHKDGIPYKGVLFAGVMIVDGKPKLLEYNVRFGDPECQVLMTRLKSDLAPILLASCNKKLDECDIEFHDKSVICVVMAANGYPAAYKKGTEIKNTEVAEKDYNVIIYHAGTKYDDSKLLANGGRVLGVTAIEDNIINAQKVAYEAIDKIDWDEGFCRKDIGWRAIERCKS